MQVVYQNQFLEESQISLKTTNRGFLYGDGFFETILFANNRLPHINEHYTRITNALTAYELTPPSFFNSFYLNDIIEELCKKNQLKNARVKIMFWRKEGGFYTPENDEFDFLISTTPFTPITNTKEQVLIYKENINIYSSLSEYKPLSASKYVKAGLFKRKNKLDDIIILGQEGTISEALYSNIFWFKNNKIFTPSIKTGCVSGVMRSLILAHTNIVEEVIVNSTEIQSADAIFTSNALGIQHITQIGNQKFPKSNITDELFQQLIGKYF